MSVSIGTGSSCRPSVHAAGASARRRVAQRGYPSAAPGVREAAHRREVPSWRGPSSSAAAARSRPPGSRTRRWRASSTRATSGSASAAASRRGTSRPPRSPPPTSGVAAAAKALEAAGVAKDEVDMVVFATMTPDHYFPGCGTLLQSKLGPARPVPCFDIRQQCSGFLYGLQLADAQIRAGHGEDRAPGRRRGAHRLHAVDAPRTSPTRSASPTCRRPRRSGTGTRASATWWCSSATRARRSCCAPARTATRGRARPRAARRRRATTRSSTCPAPASSTAPTPTPSSSAAATTSR